MRDNNISQFQLPSTELVSWLLKLPFYHRFVDNKVNYLPEKRYSFIYEYFDTDQ